MTHFRVLSVSSYLIDFIYAAEWAAGKLQTQVNCSDARWTKGRSHLLQNEQEEHRYNALFSSTQRVSIDPFNWPVLMKRNLKIIYATEFIRLQQKITFNSSPACAKSTLVPPAAMPDSSIPPTCKKKV